MWSCKRCGRIFEKSDQVHSCRMVPLGKHFSNKEKARELFDCLFNVVNKDIGKCKVVSIPCCIHLFGSYDFLAVLPKQDRIEIRFGLNRKLEGSRIKQVMQTSIKGYKNCIDISRAEEVDKELVGWIDEAYHLKDVKSDRKLVIKG